jgi:hypothetical protein
MSPRVTGLELAADRLDVPAGHERRRRLDERPRLLDELVQRPPRPLSADLSQIQ